MILCFSVVANQSDNSAPACLWGLLQTVIWSRSANADVIICMQAAVDEEAAAGRAAVR